MELETRRKSGQRGLNGGPYRAVTFLLLGQRAKLPTGKGTV